MFELINIRTLETIILCFFLAVIFLGCQATNHSAPVQKQEQQNLIWIEAPSKKAGDLLGEKESAKREVLQKKLTHLHNLLILSVWVLEAKEQEKLEKSQQNFTEVLASKTNQENSEKKVAEYRERKARIMRAANALADSANAESYSAVIGVLDGYINNH